MPLLWIAGMGTSCGVSMKKLPRPNIFILATLQMKSWGTGPWENFKKLEIWQEYEYLGPVFQLKFHLGIMTEIFA